MIVAGVATIKSRKRQCIKAVLSVYHQVDTIVVCQNGYHDMYMFQELDYLSKIIVFSTESIIGFKDMGDANKFLYLENANYFFSFDDDLIFEQNAVKKLKKALKENSKYTVASFHGRTMKGGANSYYGDALYRYRCLHEENKLIQLDFPGTGCCLIDNFDNWISGYDFKEKNVADIILGILCKKHKKLILGVPHKKGLISQQKVDGGIYETEIKGKQELQNRLLKEWQNIEI